MKLTTLTLLLLLSGCNDRWWTGRVDYSPVPDQDEAMGLVWGFYGAAPRPLPAVGWMEKSDCIDAGAPGFIDGESMCVRGEYFPDLGLILLAKREVIHESSLAHELGHAASLFLTGDADHNHVGVYFIAGGLVDQANTILLEHGF